VNTISKCHICGKFFDSKKKLKDHKDNDHRISSSHMTVNSGEALGIVRDILSSNDEVLSVAVINRGGQIIAGESRASFKERFELGNLDGQSSYGGTLAVATLSVVNEAKAAFGEPQAIITIHKTCKLMLVPMLSYDTLIGLVFERSANVDNDKLVNKIERLVAHALDRDHHLRS
jgi:hypothetical protein